MGYELWTSPITGYRRKGTRLSELRTLTEAGITARAILEPLKSCPSDTPGPEAAQMLRRRDFDVAGVKESQGGEVIAWVKIGDLKDGLVQDHKRSLTADDLISDAASLSAVLNTLKKSHFTFVLIGSEVGGIVTRADLNKPPVRIYLFSLISLLEMHLGFWIRAEYPDDSWQNHLSDGRLSDAKKLQETRRKKNQEQTLLECLQFCDKRDLLVSRKQLRDRLGMGSKRSALQHLKKAESLRNELAHSQQNLAHGLSWERMIILIEWIEMIVDRSDSEVEEKAEQHAGRYTDGLWTSA